MSTLLPAGATIRIIAPSSWFDHSQFEQGVATLRSWGYDVLYDPDMPRRAERYTAGSVRARAEELTAALQEDGPAAIWAARGGYGAMQLLPHLDPRLIRNSGKLLLGFSDITALHLLWRECDAPSVHAPNITTLAACDEASRDHLRRLLSGDDPPRTMTGAGGVGKGFFDGHLIGGNLAMLAAMCGTPYKPNLRNAILFIEEIGERPYRLDRMLTQLDLSGWLGPIGAVVLGDFVGCDPTAADGSGYKGFQVAVDFFTARNVAVAWGFPVGHGERCHPLPYGARVSLNPERAQLTFVYV